MLALLRSLVQHQAYADAAVLTAILRHEAAARDPDLRTLLHHILVAHRYWLFLCRGLPFAPDERDVPASLGELVSRFRATQAQELEWLSGLEESDLARTVETPHFPGRQIPISDALVQVCLHSQGHRSQCASRLRALGGEPPTVDYILWLQTRAAPDWSAASA
jgi:uncharacterized damage-inducible protein DinB